MEFSTRSMKQILKANTEKRVSEPAADSLGESLENWAMDISEEALEVAGEDDRSTVRSEDIREVLRRRKNREVNHRIEI